MPRLQGICFLIALSLCGASFAAHVDVMLEQGDATPPAGAGVTYLGDEILRRET